MFYIVRLLFLSMLLCSCSHIKEEDTVKIDDAKFIHSKAIAALNSNDYATAIKYFEQLEQEYPADQLAIWSNLQRTYTYFEDSKYDEAIIAADEFLTKYPWHDEAAYIYYIKAICYYQQILDSGRDQMITKKALIALNDVIKKYKNSEYAKDAMFKRDFVVSTLAKKEMDIGYFYLNNNKLLAAMGRFATVINNYDTTVFVQEALYRMVETNIVLDIKDEAVKYAAILGYNYNNSTWYRKAYRLLKQHNIKNIKVL